jgi:F-box protein 42
MSLVNNSAQIEDLPDEVLEFILSLIPPYKDLHDCMQVSKRWRRCVLNVAKTKQRNLHKAIVDFDIRWDTLTPVDMAPTISKRYSHTAVIHENSMYVFGGCTCSMTTFNDLWKLDLSKRQWVRPVAMGTYPSPKACSSLVCYKDLLVLFGGWAYPPSYPLYQSWHLFNELHIYDIIANRWTCINTTNAPPPTAGHSVSVVGEWMIMFGGIHKPSTAVHCEKSNDVWKLNLETWSWHRQEVEGEPRPHGRLGQTQVVLDNNNLLIIGGSGGPTLNYCDAWILNMEGVVWRWKQVEIEGKSNKPNNIWTNPGCKVMMSVCQCFALCKDNGLGRKRICKEFSKTGLIAITDKNNPE